MKIDKIYINEAVRIRKEYLKNLIEIDSKEKLVKNIIENMTEIKKELENDNDFTEEQYRNKLIELSGIIKKIEDDIMPHHKNIKELDTDQKKLYKSIKNKYPKISDDDIQKEIIPHIINIDNEIKEKL